MPVSDKGPFFSPVTLNNTKKDAKNPMESYNYKITALKRNHNENEFFFLFFFSLGSAMKRSLRKKEKKF